MGLLQKINSAPQVDSVQQEPPKKEVEPLTKEELEILLRTLANADLKGREVEVFYNMAVKLQKQYLNLTK
jgi:hypothetical protein